MLADQFLGGVRVVKLDLCPPLRFLDLLDQVCFAVPDQRSEINRAVGHKILAILGASLFGQAHQYLVGPHGALCDVRPNFVGNIIICNQSRSVCPGGIAS